MIRPSSSRNRRPPALAGTRPWPTSSLTTITGASRRRSAAAARSHAAPGSAPSSSDAATQSVSESRRRTWSPTAAASVTAIGRWASSVCQACGRRRRCAAMRMSSSGSPGHAVATNVTRSPPSVRARSSANALFPLAVPPRTRWTSAMSGQAGRAQQRREVDRSAEPARDLAVRIGRERAGLEREAATPRERAEDRFAHALDAEQPMHVGAEDSSVGAHRAVGHTFAVRPHELGERRGTVALGLADMKLVPGEVRVREPCEGAAALDASGARHGPLRSSERRPYRQEPEPARLAWAAIDAGGVREGQAEHLEAPADPDQGHAGIGERDDARAEAARAKPLEIGERRFASRKDDEVGNAERGGFADIANASARGGGGGEGGGGGGGRGGGDGGIRRAPAPPR